MSKDNNKAETCQDPAPASHSFTFPHDAAPPGDLVEKVRAKLDQKLFDSGTSFCLVLDTDRPEGHRLQLSTTRPLKAQEDIWVVDHAWCFRSESEAREVLRDSEALRRRMVDLLEFSAPSHPLRVEEEVDLIIGRMGPWLGSYRRPSGKSVMYVMDEVGSRLQHAEPFASPEDERPSEAFDCCLVLDQRTGASYTAFWPARDVEEGEVAYCRGLPNRLGLRLASLDVLEAFEDAPPAQEEEEENDLEALHEQIGKLRACLKEHDFTVARTSQLLGLREELGDLLPVWELSTPTLLETLEPHLKEACEGSHPPSKGLELLIRLFLLRNAVPPERIVKDLGRDVWEGLVKLGFLYPAPGAPQNVISLVQLSPVATAESCTLHVATDFSQAGKGAFDPTMYVGVDSLGLVAAVPQDKPAGRVLDLCAGCGVQGLTAVQRGADSATLVEVNPRAARFARFNAVLNGMADRVHVVPADVLMLSKLGSESLSEALEAPAFDTILANPPYIPSGGVPGLHKYGDGGKSGEEVLEGVVRLAAKTLQAGGSLYVVANLVNLDGLPGRVRHWWASAESEVQPQAHEPPSVRVFHGRRWSVEEYACLVTGSGKQPGAEPSRYFQALSQAGVVDVSNGFILVRRAAEASTEGRHEEGRAVRQLEDELWQMLAIGGERSQLLKRELHCGS